MLEWVCPHCDRAVDPGLSTCPFCHSPEALASVPSAPRRSFWADVERGFRFGLGLVSVLALVYFLLIAVAYLWEKNDLLDRLTRWLYGH